MNHESRTMNVELTADEQKLVDHAKEAIRVHNTIRHEKGDIDTLFAFILTDSGKMYDGGCFEPNIAHATVCGERHAIANMVLGEGHKAKIKSIVIADPVPSVQEKGTPPCGTCRHLIWAHGTPETAVILLQYIQHGADTGDLSWTFPKIEKFSAKDFYPHPYEPVPGLWD